nr:CusA/CzcA family heavy metal efflux RND transporter [uncultured Bacteroides sp.]
MIERIIQFSIKNKFIIGLFIVALIGWGTYSLTRLPIDAIPDITNNQVQIISIAPSLAVQEVESVITAPIEVAVANIPDIIELRSISRLGLSVVTVVFKDNVDVYWARQQLNERLKEAEEVIPSGLAKIELAPISTGLGEIFQYRLAVEKGYEHKYTPMELRTLQDWVVRREMLGTPGVAEINSYGGFVKQYEIAVNPERLRAMNLTLTDIFNALEKNNENTGSAYIDKKPMAYFIRGIGLVKTIEDIQKIVVKSNSSGMPVLIRDVATVQYGNATRYGAFVVDTTESVGGVVMMLKGANAHRVIKDVETRIESIQKSLPKGVKIEPFLNRSDLVGRSISTVSRNLIEGALIVIFVLVLFLGNVRAGLVVASVIPLSMLFALSMMNLFGVSGNLMSLGAIDFGLIVDGAVIIVESVVHHVSKASSKLDGRTLTQDEMDESVFKASSRIRKAAAFGEIIILIVYLPIMALTGIEGKMFQPMAFVVCFAILGAFILSLTYVPMVSALFLDRKTVHKRNFSDKLMDKIHRFFNPIFKLALRRKRTVSISAVVAFVLSMFLFNSLGGEFIPQLEEGDLAAGVITLQGGSLSNTVEVVEKANKILLDNFPEIKHIVCKIGAGEIPTDPTPMETGDYIITLKDKSEWTSAETREELVEKMEEKLIPLAGVKLEFQQPIQMRFNELMSGSKQDVAVKIFGDDLNTLADKAVDVEKIIKEVDGAEDISVEKVTGLAQIQVNYNRDRLAQYGISIDDVNKVLRSAFAGSQAGVVYDEEKRFDLVVRLDKDYRQNLDDVKSLSVVAPNGEQIPFEQLADISIKSGPAQVSREETKRRITIGFNVRNRDVQSVISDVTAKINKQITLPTGYYISYGGQFKNLEAAKDRLAIALPIALLLIFVLLYFTFHSVKQTLLIYTAVPLSAIGGVLALWIRGMNFSISAGVGFIALFGVAVLNGIVLISEFNRLEKDGFEDITERVIKGLQTRLRPVIMTAAAASLGFLPMAISTSAGAEVQKPLATVVIGGLITSTLLTLIILPVFYVIFSTHSFKALFKRKSMKTLSVFLLLLFTAPAFNGIKAQQSKTVSLHDAIQLALDNNLNVRSSAYSVDAQKALKGASWDLEKTSVQMQYGKFNSYTKDNSFTVSQSIAFPTVYINQSKLADAKVKSSEWQLKGSRLETATMVKQVYWQLAFLHSKQRLLSYQDSLYTGFLKAAELRTKVGETNKLEMITARSQSMEIKNQLRQTVADMDILKRKLQTLLNTDVLYSPADTILKRIEYTLITDSMAVAQNPSLGYMQQQTQVSQIERKLEKSKMLPDFSIGYSSQTMVGTQDVNGISRAFGRGDRFNSVQVGVAVPLWFVSGNSKNKAAKISEKIAKTNAESYSKELSGSYRSLLDEYSKYSGSVDYYEKQAIPEANLIIDQSTRSYKSGAMDYFEYVLSLGRALDIKQNYLDALNSYNQTIINIEFITGKIF